MTACQLIRRRYSNGNPSPVHGIRVVVRTPTRKANKMESTGTQMPDTPSGINQLATGNSNTGDIEGTG